MDPKKYSPESIAAQALGWRGVGDVFQLHPVGLLETSPHTVARRAAQRCDLCLM